jgi:enolase-phosphatase E1
MIASLLKREPEQVVFISDVIAELDAASSTGMKTLHMVRPGNAEPAGEKHRAANSFYDLQVLVPEEINS